MEFRACCCLKPRTGALLAGIIDSVLGVLVIVAICSLQFGYFDKPEERPEVIIDGTSNGSVTVVTEVLPVPPTTQPVNETGISSGINSDGKEKQYTYSNDWNAAVYLYAFYALFTLAHGLILLVAAGKKNLFLTGAALAENALRILGCVAGSVGMFILGYHWLILILMPFAVALQLYFFWVVIDYHKYFSYSQPLNVKPRT